MNDQPTALRLADALEQQFPLGTAQNFLDGEAAAELRRLHAENESLRQIVEDFPPIEAELQEVSDRAHRAEAQRDALLEALKTCVCAMQDYQAGIGITEMFDKGERMGRAAIAKAEGQP